ncbi:hypothetical protein ACM55K_13285 [Flavobacterium sp. LT1R49]|uniref:hypothetical protein n=1 Tax=Flavobacterium arabinosi TaxID=3398737 RepID=UPI003A845573
MWFESSQGHFYGMGYNASDIGFTDPSEIKEYVTPCSTNQYNMQLILTYAEKYPGKVLFKQNHKEL